MPTSETLEELERFNSMLPCLLHGDTVLALCNAYAAELEALQRFKDYVHKRMDEAGIPTHPDGEHSKHGCRIGDRLDIALAGRSELEAVETQKVYSVVDERAAFEAWFKAEGFGDYSNSMWAAWEACAVQSETKTELQTAAAPRKVSEEDVARAIALSDGHEWDDLANVSYRVDFHGHPCQEDYLLRAKAAIKALLLNGKKE